MITKQIMITIILFFICNIMVWYQLNSQLVWKWAEGMKSMWLVALLGIPISLLFWWGTRIGYQGFGTLWQTRLLAFAISMCTFPIMTWVHLGETITLKIGMSILLAILILLLQLI